MAVSLDTGGLTLSSHIFSSLAFLLLPHRPGRHRPPAPWQVGAEDGHFLLVPSFVKGLRYADGPLSVNRHRVRGQTCSHGMSRFCARLHVLVSHWGGVAAEDGQRTGRAVQHGCHATPAPGRGVGTCPSCSCAPRSGGRWKTGASPYCHVQFNRLASRGGGAGAGELFMVRRRLTMNSML